MSAVKADSKGRPIVNPAPVTIAEEKFSYVPSSNPTPTREVTSEEREERRLRRIAEEAELERQRKEKSIALKEKQIKKSKLLQYVLNP